MPASPTSSVRSRCSVRSAPRAGTSWGCDRVTRTFAAHSTVAMVAGMAAFRSTFFGGKPPPREAIVAELTQASLHGFLHRER